MGLNWNEIKSRALLFSKTWGDACDEDSYKQRSAIEQAAQCVCYARAQFASLSLAGLYGSLSMPTALLKVHQKVDADVDVAYLPSGGEKSCASDGERVRFLFGLYQRISSLLASPVAKKTRKPRHTES